MTLVVDAAENFQQINRWWGGINMKAINYI